MECQKDEGWKWISRTIATTTTATAGTNKRKASEDAAAMPKKKARTTTLGLKGLSRSELSA
jgi:hypothetical protein